MAWLINPPSYLSVSTFLGMANDFDLSSYSNAQLAQKLSAASAWANSIMRRNLIATEETHRYIGDGTDKLDLGKKPILYIKRAQIVIPGPTGYSLPVNELLIDYETGDVFEYAPLYWAGAGYRSLFPHGAPIDITFGWGYGFTTAVAPVFTEADTGAAGTGLPAGTYNLAVTARTFWGETSALVQQVTTTSGFLNITITSGIGTYTYRTYLSSGTLNTTTTSSEAAGATSVTVASATGITAGSYWLYDSGFGVQEVVQVTSAPVGSTVPITATVNAHNNGVKFIPAPINVAELPVSAFGGNPIAFVASSLTPSNNLPYATLPTVDTSAPPTPWEIQEATRILTLAAIFEQNNLANRGIYATKSGERTITWKSTEGAAGKGVPTLAQQATDLLRGYTYQGIG